MSFWELRVKERMMFLQLVMGMILSLFTSKIYKADVAKKFIPGALHMEDQSRQHDYNLPQVGDICPHH